MNGGLSYKKKIGAQQARLPHLPRDSSQPVLGESMFNSVLGLASNSLDGYSCEQAVRQSNDALFHPEPAEKVAFDPILSINNKTHAFLNHANQSHKSLDRYQNGTMSSFMRGKQSVYAMNKTKADTKHKIQIKNLQNAYKSTAILKSESLKQTNFCQKIARDLKNLPVSNRPIDNKVAQKIIRNQNS